MAPQLRARAKAARAEGQLPAQSQPQRHSSPPPSPAPRPSGAEPVRREGLGAVLRRQASLRNRRCDYADELRAQLKQPIRVCASFAASAAATSYQNGERNPAVASTATVLALLVGLNEIELPLREWPVAFRRRVSSAKGCFRRLFSRPTSVDEAVEALLEDEGKMDSQKSAGKSTDTQQADKRKNAAAGKGSRKGGKAKKLCEVGVGAALGTPATSTAQQQQSGSAAAPAEDEHEPATEAPTGAEAAEERPLTAAPTSGASSSGETTASGQESDTDMSSSNTSNPPVGQDLDRIFDDVFDGQVSFQRSWSEGDVANLRKAGAEDDQEDCEFDYVSNTKNDTQGRPMISPAAAATPMAMPVFEPAQGLWMSEALALTAAMEASKSGWMVLFPAVDRSVYMNQQYFD